VKEEIKDFVYFVHGKELEKNELDRFFEFLYSRIDSFY
jgi:hypothetical protein